jgi:DNA-binding XRE family transcriptional regulator
MKHPDFSEKLRQLRDTAGFTQQELAKEIDLNFKSYQSWEEGRAKPRYEDATKIANYFSISLDELLTPSLTGKIKDMIVENTKAPEQTSNTVGDITATEFKFWIGVLVQAAADATAAAKESAAATKEAINLVKESKQAQDKTLSKYLTFAEYQAGLNDLRKREERLLEMIAEGNTKDPKKMKQVLDTIPAQEGAQSDKGNDKNKFYN